MSWQRICAAVLATAGLAAAGPATAGQRHWFYDSYGAYERSAVDDFGVLAASPPRADGSAGRYRQAPVAPAKRPQRALTDVPKPRAKPAVSQELATRVSEPAVVRTTAPVDKVSGASISCDKARRIVSGFGFSDIHALSCSGKEYGFSAKRDGEDFDIRLSSLTGELIRVKHR